MVDSKKYMLRLWQIYVTSLTTPYQTSTWFGLVSEWQGKTMIWPGSSKTITIYWNIILSNVWYYHTGWKCHRDRLHYSNCCARHRADTIMQIGCYPPLQTPLLLSKSGKKADILLINCPLHYKTINGLDFTGYILLKSCVSNVQVKQCKQFLARCYLYLWSDLMVF